jgi:hypothetical protein
MEDNVGINLKEINLEGVDWINVARDRDEWRAVVNTVMSIRAACRAWNIFCPGELFVSFPRRTQPLGGRYLKQTLTDIIGMDREADCGLHCCVWLKGP